MKTFKILAAPIVIATAALSLAAPAQAQNYGHNRDASRFTSARNAEIRQDINSLNKAIDRAAARRAISQREATRLRRDTRDVRRLYASYARDGLSRREVQALQSRVNSVRVSLRMERRDWDRRIG